MLEKQHHLFKEKKQKKKHQYKGLRIWRRKKEEEGFTLLFSHTSLLYQLKTKNNVLCGTMAVILLNLEYLNSWTTIQSWLYFLPIGSFDHVELAHPTATLNTLALSWARKQTDSTYERWLRSSKLNIFQVTAPAATKEDKESDVRTDLQQFEIVQVQRTFRTRSFHHIQIVKALFAISYNTQDTKNTNI